MTRFHKALVPLLLGCSAGMAHAQLGIPDEEIVGRYAPIIDAASRRHGVDDALVHALIFTESSYDPKAVSRAGALGLMQLMPETARRYGARDPLDPAQNVEAGVRMLRELLDLFDDDLELALAAYNAGPGAVIRAGRRIPRYQETLAYVPRVLGFYRAYRAAEAKASNDETFDPLDAFDAYALLGAILASPGPAPANEPEVPEQTKRPACLASTRRQRKKHPARSRPKRTASAPWRRSRGA